MQTTFLLARPSLWRLPKEQFLTLLFLLCDWPGASIAQAQSAGTVVAWGDNDFGETTVPIAAQSGVTAIAAGGYHTVALIGTVPLRPFLNS